MTVQLGQQTAPWGSSTWELPTWILTTITETVTMTNNNCALTQASIGPQLSQTSLSTENGPSYTSGEPNTTLASPIIPGATALSTANGFINYTPTTGSWISWTPWTTFSTVTTTMFPTTSVTLTTTVTIPASLWPRASDPAANIPSNTTESCHISDGCLSPVHESLYITCFVVAILLLLMFAIGYAAHQSKLKKGAAPDTKETWSPEWYRADDRK